MASADRNGEAANSSRLGAMSSLLGRLDKLTDRGGILQLRDDLCKISDKLRNLSELHDPPLTVKYWMKHARELSYDMEDYLDNSEFKMEDTIDDSDAKKNKISGFRTRVEGMNERYDRFNLQSFLNGDKTTTTLVSQRLSQDVAPVGMGNRTNELRSLLEPKGDGEYNKKLKIVSILGVEGIGKSTLIQELWRQLESEQNFECRAFVRSAKTPDIRMILRSILSQICLHEKAEDSGVPNLIRDIKNHLQNKRYFIIIDDLWDVSVWDVIGHAFPDCGVGSRIITTTTDEDVAQACCSYDHVYEYNMEPLNVDDSRELFIRTIVGSAKENPQLSNDVSEEIKRKCGGLPLSIIWAAILVASQPETKQKLFQLEAKQELSKSQKEENLDSDVKTFLDNKLRKNSTPVQILNQSLKLCYNSLDHCLKTCLLYLSVYPENYLILKADLVKLWVAEGFISTLEGEDKLEVAGSYFDILVSLGMIQRMDINCNKKHHQEEVKILRISNMVEVEGEENPLRLPYYVVHPTVFNFIACKSMEDNFITIIDSSQSKVVLKDKVRRLSLHFGSAAYAPTLESTALSQARTLSFMGLQRCMPSLVLFKLVRVLILHLWADNGDPTFSLAEINELLLLRYLQVQCNAIVELPLKIGCMEQLQTLEMNSRVAAIPSDILYLPRLLHVRIGEKTNLTLGPISSVKAISSDELLPPMDAPPSKSIPSVQIFEVPPICIFPRLPEWIAQLYKLSILEIAVRELWTSQSESDIDILAKLPALTALSLYVRTPTEGNIIFRRGAFPALGYFKFMCGVLLLDFQEEAAPNLRILKIGFNVRKGLKYGNILVGIQHLLKLEEVAASIGANTGAEKYDRIAAEYELKDAISAKQPRPPKLNVKWVHQLEEEHRPPPIASRIIGIPYPVASQITNVDPLTLLQPVNEQDEVLGTRGMPTEDSTGAQPTTLDNMHVKEKNERANLRMPEFVDLPEGSVSQDANVSSSPIANVLEERVNQPTKDACSNLRESILQNPSLKRVLLMKFGEIECNGQDIAKSFGDRKDPEIDFTEAFITCLRHDNVPRDEADGGIRIIVNAKITVILNSEEAMGKFKNPHAFQPDALVDALKNCLPPNMNINDIKLIMVPLCHRDHWTVYVINVRRMRIDILDSNPYGTEMGGTTWQEHHAHTSDLYGDDRRPWYRIMIGRLSNAFHRIIETEESIIMPHFEDWDVDLAKDLPRMEANSSEDCAFFLMRFLQFYDYERGIVDKDKCRWESGALRSELLHYLLFHPKNELAQTLPHDIKKFFEADLLAHEEEYPPSDKFRLTRHEGSSSEQKNKEKACAEDIDKHIDSRLTGELDLPLASRTSDHHKSGSSVQKSEASLITPSPTSGKDNLNHHQEKKQWTDKLGLISWGGLFWHGVADRLTGKNMAAWKEGRISGIVVLVKKEALSHKLGDFPASLLDGIHHNTGFDVQFQLVSATKGDPGNGGKGTVGKTAYLKVAVVQLQYKANRETAFRVNFEWDMSQGIPGAVLVRNLQHDEFFLKMLTLEGVPGKGTVVFVANSWIYPRNLYSQDRIFFTNDTYLPSKMPAALMPYRQDELKILRGDDNPGPYKEHDRVYRYDYYNDLGEPDKGEDRARPILGGSQEHPYPRRCRTGRHPTTTDPTESRPLLLNMNIYVPRDEWVGDYKTSDFLGYSLMAFTEAASLIKVSIGDTPMEFDSFEDILGLYELSPEAPNNPLIAEISEFLRSRLPKGSHGNPLKMPLPNIIKSDILKKAPEFKFGWRTDEEFSRETLAGVNPVIIKRLTEFPVNSTLDPLQYGDHTSKITEAHIQHNLEGYTVQNALKNNKLFILDHHDHFMPYLDRINKLKGNFIYASRTLLFLKDDGTLKPVAIELSLPHPDGQQHGVDSKVYTPAHTGVAGHIWQLAKAYACVNDSAWHQLISHWLNTHAVIEPFVIVTNRQLSVVHPVHKLLRPHYRDTLNINAVARQTLINADGIFERTMFPAKYALEMSSDVYKSQGRSYRVCQALPADLVKRGVAVPDNSSPYGVRLLIKDYPYAVDGLVIWWAIERWVMEYLDVYYSNDGELQRDVEVQAWWKEVREEAHGDLRDRDWWPRMDTVRQLARTCTTIIWVASALHAAVNFGQYAYAGYLPNRPTVSRRPMPEPGSDDYKKLEAGQEEADKVFIRTFTSQFQTIQGIMLIEILSRHSSDEVYLGQRRDSELWTSDARALVAFERFRNRLVEIEGRIKMMNDDPILKNRTGPVGMPYTLLYPNTSDVTGKKGEGLSAMGIPNSISI